MQDSGQSHYWQTRSALQEVEPSGVAQSRLNSEQPLNDAFQRLRSHIIQSDERGLPRYGVLSILARRVPFHLYDHPALTALCRTAFTDGIHVFVNTEFFKEIATQDIDGNEDGVRYQSMVLILLHELCHILFRHHSRMPPNAPPLFWAIACDISINTRLLTAYSKLRPGPIFEEAWGTKQSDIDTYLGRSEEHLLQELWDSPPAETVDLVAAIRVKMDAGSETIDGELDERGHPQDVHHHLVSPADLSRVLMKNGLEHVRQELRLPNPNDKPALQKLLSANALFLTGDLDKAREIRDLHPQGNGMAGAHLEQASAEWIDNELRGRLEWKKLLRELMLGEGMQFDPCDELPSDIYFIDPDQMGLDTPLYIGSLAPASPKGILICIVDTSLSISRELLKVFVGEINHLIDHESVRPDQIYLVNADSSVRTEVKPFAEHELSKSPDKIAMIGRGGTDITRVINEVLLWSQQQAFSEADLGAIIYFTDLLDHAPRRDALPERLPDLLFLTPPSYAVRNFQNRVEDFATVAEIRDGTVIDLCRN